MTSHIFVRYLPRDVKDSEVNTLFKKYGTIRKIEVTRLGCSAAAFVDFKHHGDAKDAIRGRHNYNYDDFPLSVNFTYRAIVSKLPRAYKWQDLKELMCEAGDVVYADVREDGTGVVDFARRDGAENAIKTMHNTMLKGSSSSSAISVTAASKMNDRPQGAARSATGNTHDPGPLVSDAAGHSDVGVASSGQKRDLSPARGDRSGTKRRQRPCGNSVQHSCGISDRDERAAHAGQICLGTSSSSSGGTGVEFTVPVRDCRNKERDTLACPENLLVDMNQTLTEAIEHITRFVGMATSSSGDTRVPHLAFIRLGRGGKSTFLWYLHETLKEKGFSPIHISFNGGFPRDPKESQLSALLRLLGSEFVNPSTTDKESLVCTTRTVIDHINRTSESSKVVLLIDDLNVLAGGPLDAETVWFLKSEFLDKVGRYLVFTSQIPIDLDESRCDPQHPPLLPITTRMLCPRGFLPVRQPHSLDLAVLRSMPGCEDLTPTEVAIYGGIPSLIYSTKGHVDLTPRERFDHQDINVPRDDQSTVLSQFITEVLEGTQLNRNTLPFYGFASMHSYWQLWWPVCYIECILRLFSDYEISEQFPKLVEAHLTASASASPEGNCVADGDWDLIVQAALMLRCMSAKLNCTRGPFGIAEYGVIPDVDFRALVGEITTLAQAQVEIESQLNGATRPTIMLFKPAYASFPEYDGFVGYKATDNSIRVIGHQEKLSRAYPKRDVPENSWIERSVHLRGTAPAAANKCSGWEYLDRAAIQNLLGASLKPLYPANWPVPPAVDGFD